MVEVVPIHVIGIATSFVLLYQSFRLARAGKENVLEFLLWTSFGVGLLFYTLARVFTNLDIVSHIDAFFLSLGFGTGERGLLVLAIISLYLLVLYTYTLTKTNHEQLTDVQQELALLRYEIEELSDDLPDADRRDDGRATDGLGERTDGGQGTLVHSPEGDDPAPDPEGSERPIDVSGGNSDGDDRDE